NPRGTGRSPAHARTRRPSVLPAGQALTHGQSPRSDDAARVSAGKSRSRLIPAAKALGFLQAILQELLRARFRRLVVAPHHPQIVLRPDLTQQLGRDALLVGVVVRIPSAAGRTAL